MECNYCDGHLEPLDIKEEIESYYRCQNCKIIQIDYKDSEKLASYGCGLVTGILALIILIIKSLNYLQ